MGCGLRVIFKAALHLLDVLQMFITLVFNLLLT